MTARPVPGTRTNATARPRPEPVSGRSAARSRRDPQHGGASVIALGIGLCVLVFAMVAFMLAAAIEARHRAQVGADVAALAGAIRAGQGAAPACERAAQLAVANHTTILDCELSGLDITVEVSAPLPGPLQRFGPVIGHARAGPIAAPSS